MLLHPTCSLSTWKSLFVSVVFHYINPRASLNTTTHPPSNFNASLAFVFPSVPVFGSPASTLLKLRTQEQCNNKCHRGCLLFGVPCLYSHFFVWLCPSFVQSNTDKILFFNLLMSFGLIKYCFMFFFSAGVYWNSKTKVLRFRFHVQDLRLLFTCTSCTRYLIFLS